MNEKTKAALIGGVVAGLLTAIPGVNSCCCIWAALGGVVAVYMYVKGSVKLVSSGEGAMLGLIAGGVGSAIYIVLGIPLGLAFRSSMMSMMSGFMGSMPAEQQDAMRQAMEQNQSAGFAGMIMQAIFVIVLLLVFSTLGGLLGVPLFEKRKGGAGTPPPPPPPNFGGPTGGTTGYSGQPGSGYGGPTGSGPTPPGGGFGAGS